MKPHVHTESCHRPCSREWDVDEESVTGAHRIVTRKGYGRRPMHDKPRWWPFAFHAYKAAIQVLTIVVLAVVAKRCGLPAELP